MTTNKLRIAFVGLGSMGLGMAKNLLAKGHAVIGVDMNPDAGAALRASGGQTAASPRAAAAQADALVLVVVNAAQVEQVLFGAEGAVGALPQGRVVMQCATVPPGFSTALGERLAAAGHPLLDAPLSGGRARADTGELTVMSSGTPQAYAQAEAILDAVAAKVYRLGDAPGIGSLVKTVNQLLAGVHIAAAAEAMALGTKAGADPRALYEVISNSAGNSWMFTNRVPHMLDGDFTPLSAVDIFVKDLGLVLDTGREVKQPLPLAAAAHQMFLMATAAGWGKMDDAAVVKIYEQMGAFSVAERAGKRA
ncbi:NAD(P)-dependent oxidoreductase [Vineibacter terrae]|uniref:L-threonate dehydrogenase n=1 Tax=Vineibacter terrae TaxID=2586908 RepID=A0A5C8P8B4_9HYPH|nr:L-threonate dehydrogenase [Vineibacter terrae]TXL69779.1 NAD(P)-dependent oxidoreductase [Vineibacter terrae]